MCAKPISLMYSNFSGSGSGADFVTCVEASTHASTHAHVDGTGTRHVWVLIIRQSALRVEKRQYKTSRTEKQRQNTICISTALCSAKGDLKERAENVHARVALVPQLFHHQMRAHHVALRALHDHALQQRGVRLVANLLMK